MQRTSVIRFGLAALAATAASGAVEARSPVNKWYCEVLNNKFDPKAAIAKFPLEKLPPAVEEVDVKDEGEDGKRTNVTVAAEGKIYKVQYGYSYKNNDVSDPYGLDLRIYVGYPESETAKLEMDKWLKEWGTPEKSTMGQAVYAGPPIYEDGDKVFSFERWKGSAVYIANWWSKGDIRYAAELCK